MSFSIKDKILAPSTGLVTGVIAWRLAVFLELPRVGLSDGLGNGDVSYAWLILVLPILWVFVLILGSLLSRIAPFFSQLTRFCIIGTSNAFVDYGYLNILIAFSGIHSGAWFSVFKGASFVVATISSYFLNKYWAFGASNRKASGSEFGKFFAISVTAMAVNIATASIVVNVVNPMWGLSPAVWANIGAISGSITALIFNFLGYKFIVFKTQK